MLKWKFAIAFAAAIAAVKAGSAQAGEAFAGVQTIFVVEFRDIQPRTCDAGICAVPATIEIGEVLKGTAGSGPSILTVHLPQVPVYRRWPTGTPISMVDPDVRVGRRYLVTSPKGGSLREVLESGSWHAQPLMNRQDDVGDVRLMLSLNSMPISSKAQAVASAIRYAKAPHGRHLAGYAAGLLSFGTPLDREHAHRPQLDVDAVAGSGLDSALIGSDKNAFSPEGRIEFVESLSALLFTWSVPATYTSTSRAGVTTSWQKPDEPRQLLASVPDRIYRAISAMTANCLISNPPASGPEAVEVDSTGLATDRVFAVGHVLPWILKTERARTQFANSLSAARREEVIGAAKALAADPRQPNARRLTLESLLSLLGERPTRN